MRARDFDRKKFILEEWPAALESGEFLQGEDQLYNSEDNSYCCLGVACELLTRYRLLKRYEWEHFSSLPNKAMKLLQIPNGGDFISDNNEEDIGLLDSLASWNDEGKTFGEIAEKIRSIEKEKKWDISLIPSEFG